MNPSSQPTSYEEVPYESGPFAYTHPESLATMAALFGMAPPPVERCRVLELGCASGGNLIPMALGLPESRFVGIDLSQRQIAEGRAMVAELNLANIELEAMSILDFRDPAEFDYIICHGVYSWVPAAVQDRILSICAENLAPNGVAYVSYNTYPGWHVRGMIREMMCYAIDRRAGPLEQVRQAREFLDFLIASVHDAKSLYSLLLQEEAMLLRTQTDSYLLHEHLEESNEPLYFYQFVERATARGLQYLAEAKPSGAGAKLSPEAWETLKRASANHIELEQRLDFLHDRTFRRSLLCHERVELQRSPPPETLRRFHLAASAKPESDQPDLTSTEAEGFRARGVSLSTNHPLVKAALVLLYEESPRRLAFDRLWEMVLGRLGCLEPGHSAGDVRFGPADWPSLAAALLQCWGSGLVHLHLHPAKLVLEAGERPLASPLARLQAARGGSVTNMRHYEIQITSVDAAVLRHLDGSRGRAELAETLAGLVASGELAVEQADGAPLGDDVLRREVDSSLERLAKGALLVG
ncbi:MAG: class I SAM-dependent methyltransferase [Pirellulales bacterium]